jgi:hypothetical protein
VIEFKKLDRIQKSNIRMIRFSGKFKLKPVVFTSLCSGAREIVVNLVDINHVQISTASTGAASTSAVV